MRDENSGITKVMLLPVCLFFVFTGCTVINIENADSVKTTFYPGLAVIQVNDFQNNVAISSRGFGAQLNGAGVTVGCFQEQRVYINDSSHCISVFFDDQTELSKNYASAILTNQ